MYIMAKLDMVSHIRCHTPYTFLCLDYHPSPRAFHDFFLARQSAKEYFERIGDCHFCFAPKGLGVSIAGRSKEEI